MNKAVDVCYVRYQIDDLPRMEVFLRDFGMAPAADSDGDRLFMRGSGEAPFVYEAVLGDECRFLGAGFIVSSEAELHRLADLPGSGSVENVSDAPGGGKRVRMQMPDGFQIDAIHGAKAVAPWTSPSEAGFNSAYAKPRKNAAVRIERRAMPVKRLGHFVLHVTNHDQSVGWLRERLGLVPSDYLGVPGYPNQIIGTFLRVDDGERWVDHHCMLVLQTPEPGVHHSSFEVEGLDAVMSAHDYLVDRGYQLDCGVGRHLLGSQIFDYWRDPFGFRIEHYTDGDVVNHLHQPSVFSGTADQTTQWGAKPPKDFFE